jgi:hypothetical protein
MVNKDKSQENVKHNEQRGQLAQDIGFLLASHWMLNRDNRMRERKQRIKLKIEGASKPQCAD